MSANMELNTSQQQSSLAGPGSSLPSSGVGETRSPETSPSVARRASSGPGQTSNGRKRRRDDGERVRVTRACDRCKAYVQLSQISFLLCFSVNGATSAGKERGAVEIGGLILSNILRITEDAGSELIRCPDLPCSFFKSRTILYSILCSGRLPMLSPSIQPLGSPSLP